MHGFYDKNEKKMIESSASGFLLLATGLSI